MIAVPLVSLVALWAFLAILTVPRAISDRNYSSSTRDSVKQVLVSLVRYVMSSSRAQGRPATLA